MLIDRNQSWSEACVEFQGNTSRLKVVIDVPSRFVSILLVWHYVIPFTWCLQGYMVGNGCTDDKFDGDAIIPFIYGMGLISFNMYKVGVT